MEKRAYSIQEFCEQYSIKQRKCYELMGAGELVARKVGDRTLIEHAEAERWFKSLPTFSEKKSRVGRRHRVSA